MRVLLLPALVLSACTSAMPAPRLDGPSPLTGPLDMTFSVPGFDDRDYLLHLPASYDGTSAMPLVVAFHGGGGNKEGVERTGCRDGDTDASNCIFEVADREGFIVVVPDGVDARGVRGRSWNAGGGTDNFRCVGGEACEQDSDDVAYVDALLEETRAVVAIDVNRTYAIGISNGAAMSHRLACDRAEVFAAIAAVAGANQAQTHPGCNPSLAVPVLHMHGTEDPCWGYDGTIEERLCENAGDGLFIGVEASMAGWRERNGCTGTTKQPIEDQERDGTRAVEVAGTGCQAETALIRIEGGGHTWPGGWQYLRERQIGRVSRDFDGNERIWSFLSRHSR